MFRPRRCYALSMVNGAAMGVECAAMTAEAEQIGPARVPLPDIPAYLRSVCQLGRRSLRPALPALALLFFYRLGMGAYMAMVLTDYHRPPGFGAKAAGIAAFLIPVLIYIPVLPLQENLLRGRPLHFLGAIRRVLDRLVNLILSGITQALVLIVPHALVAVFVGRLAPGPRWLFQWTELAWILSGSLFLFMIFATPAVVLDGEGPLHSLRTSYHLVSKNLGSTLGRFLAFAFLATVGYWVVTSPALILSTAAAPIRLAAVTWTSAVDTLFLPFWVAAVVVLYRSLRPWTDEGRA